jgi:hypothetical protein
MKNVHLKSTKAKVLAAVRAQLEEEGFEPTEATDGADIRTVAIYADGGWTGVADDPFATTEWAEVLSHALETAVFTLEGECDHAFYSRVAVHEGGEEVHRSEVPEEAKLYKDGRHRIKPKFLEKYFPKAKLGKGIVVRELGGEGNMQAVGEAVGIPRPVFNIYDEDAATLRYRFKGGGKSPIPDFGNILGIPVVSLLENVTLIGAKTEEGEPDLDASPTSSEQSVFANDDFRQHVTFTLRGSQAVRGLTVRVEGKGFELLDAPTMTAMLPNGGIVTAKRKREDFEFPDIELKPAAPPSRPALPIGERLRQGMRNLHSLTADPAQVTVYLEGKTKHEGKGTITLIGQIENGTIAESEVILEVRPALRMPILPKGAPKPHTAYINDYEGRDIGFGWVAFEGKWSALESMMLELTKHAQDAIQFAWAGPKAKSTWRASVTRKGGERLEFRKVDWDRLVPELRRGADVSLRLGDLLSGAQVALIHQPDGPNIFASIPRGANERRPPRIVLVWTCPRVAKPAPLVKMADAMLERAGAQQSVIGGLVSAQEGSPTPTTFESAYETLSGTRLATYDPRWLWEHVRAPGWRVLAPEGVAVGKGVPTRKLKYGTLLSSPAPDMFAYSGEHAAAVERAVLNAIGTIPEAEKFLKDN